MENTMELQTGLMQCKSCGNMAAGAYCNQCGQSYTTKRITLHSLLHEVFHFFTHFDKGFPFTLKQLVTRPGAMQREYVEGFRSRHQKPFSMFFVCATFAAIALYWNDFLLVKYFNTDNSAEVEFFHKYWVMLQVCMLPVYTFVVFLVFKKSGYNYAEAGVLQLYTFSFLFLMLELIHLLKFIWPHLETRFIELPAVVVYSIMTNISFFSRQSRRGVILRSVLATSVCFLLATFVQDLLVKLFH